MIRLKLIILFILGLLSLSIHARETLTDSFEHIAEYIPTGKILTITEFKGNYASEFTSELISYLKIQKDVKFIDYDIHKKVIDENLKYSEPVFDNKYSDAMPNLASPDIGIIGSANRQKSNFFFKQREHLDFEVNLVDLRTGLILYNLNNRIIMKYNVPILLLIFMIVLVLAAARWIIYLQKGYNVHVVLVITMLFITLIIVWYLL